MIPHNACKNRRHSAHTEPLRAGRFVGVSFLCQPVQEPDGASALCGDINLFRTPILNGQFRERVSELPAFFYEAGPGPQSSAQDGQSATGCLLTTQISARHGAQVWLRDASLPATHPNPKDLRCSTKS